MAAGRAVWTRSCHRGKDTQKNLFSEVSDCGIAPFFMKSFAARPACTENTAHGMPCVASGRMSGGCVRHTIGPLASRREAFATFGRHRPHKFCRYDFMGDICLREIFISCFIHRPVRQVIGWQEPCCAPRDGMRDVAAADKAHKADRRIRHIRRIRRICPRNGMKTLCGTI